MNANGRRPNTRIRTHVTVQKKRAVCVCVWNPHGPRSNVKLNNELVYEYLFRSNVRFHSIKSNLLHRIWPNCKPEETGENEMMKNGNDDDNFVYNFAIFIANAKAMSASGCRLVRSNEQRHVFRRSAAETCESEGKKLISSPENSSSPVRRVACACPRRSASACKRTREGVCARPGNGRSSNELAFDGKQLGKRKRLVVNFMCNIPNRRIVWSIRASANIKCVCCRDKQTRTFDRTRPSPVRLFPPFRL